MSLAEITMIVPYYRQPKMLEKQLETWARYAPFTLATMRIIIVDDCSPEPALDVIPDHYPTPLEVYRVLVDIPWNRSMARNLGSQQAVTKWLLHVDTDHILPPESADHLAAGIQVYNPAHWYKFRRFRVGRADDTRNKDLIPREAKFGEIKPHVDSFLCLRELYWKVGGYDPDYAGCLGGGGAFLRQLKAAGKECLAPSNVRLHVCTRDIAPDSSIHTLDRDTSEYGRRRRIKERAGNTKVTNPIRYPWERVL
jgi:hypothetical protein